VVLSSESSTLRSALKSRILGNTSPWLLLIPTLAFLVVTVSRNVLIQAGGLDAYIYTSYIQNYSDLAARYGLTYYSARIAHLYPAGLAVKVFGSYAGYFVYRFLLLTVALSAIWIFTRKDYGVATAALGVVLTSCHPWLLRSLFWDHYDSSGVVYLLVATVLIGTANPTSNLKVFIAGGAYALAANCNTFLVGVGGMLYVTYILINLRSGLRNGLRFTGISFCGFLAFYFPLCIIHYVALPAQGILFDLVAIRFSRTMMAGLGRVWHLDVIPLIQKGWIHLLVPVIVLAAGAGLAIIRRGKIRGVFMFSVINLLLVVCLFVVVDTIYKIAVISLFYYFIYLFPATWLCLVAFMGECADGLDDRTTYSIAAVSGVAALTAYIAYHSIAQTIVSLNVWVITVGAVMILACAIANRRASLRMVCAALFAILTPAAFYRMPAGTYSAIHDGSPGLEWDVYRAALELQRMVSNDPPSAGTVGFWYTNRASLLNSVQSMYLWGPSRLASPADPGGGMPVLSPSDLRRLSQFRRIFLLSERENEIDEGLRALMAAGVKMRTIGRASYDGRFFHMIYLAVERMDDRTG